MLIVLVILSFYYFMGDQVKENKPLESPVKHGTAVPVEKGVGSAIPQNSRPKEGLSIYIGQSAEAFEDEYGKPNRTEPSPYGYEWWIYNDQTMIYLGVGEDGVINQVYTPHVTANIAPFEIGQSLEEIYRFSIIGSEIDVIVGENAYTFSLNSDDLMTRPLMIYKDLFAQLYIEEDSGMLTAVRFINPETLVLHQPYEMGYMGELISVNRPSSTLQLEVNQTTERQLFELMNEIREKNNLNRLESNYRLSQLARQHSGDLALAGLASDEEGELESLVERLKNETIEHKGAAENTAFHYPDAIEAVHGWLNSPEHRKAMLSKNFTHAGTGVYANTYTQIFIKAPVESYQNLER